MARLQPSPRGATKASSWPGLQGISPTARKTMKTGSSESLPPFPPPNFTHPSPGTQRDPRGHQWPAGPAGGEGMRMTWDWQTLRLLGYIPIPFFPGILLSRTPETQKERDIEKTDD